MYVKNAETATGINAPPALIDIAVLLAWVRKVGILNVMPKSVIDVTAGV
jgi:hypothetical protein